MNNDITNIKRVSFRCCNKRCNHVWVMEFDLSVLNVNLWKFANNKTKLEFYIRKNGTCPKCNYSVSKPNVIIGRKNDTPCDHRCTNAKGHNCDCSCGGENHGRAYQIQLLRVQS